MNAPIDRRTFLSDAGVALAVAALPPAAATPHFGVAPLTSEDTTGSIASWELLLGTYTTNTASKGIYRATVDLETGVLAGLAVVAETPDPSYLDIDPGRRFVVAVNELTSYQGAASGAVTGFARSRGQGGGALAMQSQHPSRGGAPCYIHLDRSGRHALVANYVGGSVAVLPVTPDGAVGAANSVMVHAGRGPHPTRQTSPHAHCVRLDPAERFALATDLGIDRVITYRFDAAAGTLAREGELALAPGAGPRHLAFSPDGGTVYVVNELDSTLATCTYAPDRGQLTLRHVVSTRPPGATGDNFPADLHVHPAGHTVYLSNRGDDTIAVFAIDRARDRATLVQSVPTGGRWPRNFALDPEGRLLLVANQRSDLVVAFRVDPASGRLSPLGHSLAVPAPVCVQFVSTIP